MYTGFSARYELNIFVYYRLIVILNPVYSLWGLCWTKWNWVRFVLWVVSYHQCSVLIIFVLILLSFRRASGWSLCRISGSVEQKNTFIQSLSLEILNGGLDGVIWKFVILGDWLYQYYVGYCWSRVDLYSICVTCGMAVLSFWSHWFSLLTQFCNIYFTLSFVTAVGMGLSTYCLWGSLACTTC